MPQIRILAVGKVKTPFWQQAIEHYTKRMGHGFELLVALAKDADASLPMPKRLEQEAERLEKLFLPNDIIICLDEKGKEYSSIDFAKFLETIWERGKRPCFVIGGAYGLCPSIKAKAGQLMALGLLTFPHELARVVLYEQLYRAGTIMAGSGYHH